MQDRPVSEEKLSERQQTFDRLCEIVARLRAPGGCPWDREQTHISILPQLIEEAYEVVEAARSGNVPHFREELGDLLLHVVMHGEIARAAGDFDIEDVTEEITEKLIRRHPHVFGESDARDTPAVLKQWEAIKHSEKKETHEHYLDSLPTALPALMRAQKAQKKVARMNFDWARLDEVVAKVDEELGEVKEALRANKAAEIADEIGDLLFAVVNLARKTGSDAETLLQEATSKFVRRFNRVEEELKKSGKELGQADLAELDAIWNRVKTATP